MVIGEPRSEQKKKSLEASSKSSTLGGQDQKRGARFVQTGLTGLVTGLTGQSGGSVLGGTRAAKKGQVCTDRYDRSLWEFWKKFQKQQEERKAEFQATLGKI